MRVDARAVTRTVRVVLQEIETVLVASRHVDDARGEARDLLAALLDQPRSWPALHVDATLDPATCMRARASASRRASGAPLAYAVRRAAFRHLTLDVDERVLIPRPETEMLVELVLEADRAARGGLAVDVGTGSGAIALALACEGGYDRVIGIDVSQDALAVARGNSVHVARASRCHAEFRHGSLLGPVRGERVRTVVSNPPYIAFDEAAALPTSVRDWEPAIALFSAADGMAATTRLVAEAADVLVPGGLLAVEVDVRRARLVAARLSNDGRFGAVQVRLDLTGRERFVLARRRDAAISTTIGQERG